MKEIRYTSNIETICKAICSKGVYNYYRIVKTPSHIEVKLSPKNNSEQEVVYVKENDKQEKMDLRFSLMRMLNS